MRLEHLYVETEAIVKSRLWTLPRYQRGQGEGNPKRLSGAMGVPITFMCKFDNEQFEILDTIKPKVNGLALYQRIIIRLLKPDLPEYIAKKVNAVAMVGKNKNLTFIENDAKMKSVSGLQKKVDLPDKKIKATVPVDTKTLHGIMPKGSGHVPDDEIKIKGVKKLR